MCSHWQLISMVATLLMYFEELNFEKLIKFQEQSEILFSFCGFFSRGKQPQSKSLLGVQTSNTLCKKKDKIATYTKNLGQIFNQF